MSKRKQRKRSQKPSRFSFHRSRRARPDVAQALDEARQLIEAGQAEDAVDLLTPLSAVFPSNADLHYLLGFALAAVGDSWQALSVLERASKLSGSPPHQLTLAIQYMQLGMNMHALQILRRLPDDLVALPDGSMSGELVEELEYDLVENADEAELSVAQMEKGLLDLERALAAMHTGDFQTALSANRRAIRTLGHWPPPHNNLALALFHSGEPDEAIRTAREVLDRDPENLHALANLIRFQVLLGQNDEARRTWASAEPIEPVGPMERLKKAEAAAFLNRDAAVLAALKPLDREVEMLDPMEYARVQLWLAVAEANTGNRRSALRRLREIEGVFLWVPALLDALQDKQPGPSFADRYPYFTSIDLLPRQIIEELLRLFERQEQLSESRFEAELARFGAKYPYAVHVFEKWIWEEDQPEMGIEVLLALGTPAALDALRRFAFSQAGDDDLRMDALNALQEAGVFAQGEMVRVWSGGEWKELLLRSLEISDDDESYYSEKVARLINDGVVASKQGRLDDAAQFYQSALALEPKAKEAYSNLGTIYMEQKKRDEAEAMFRAAAEVDPLYVFPLCNLASLALADGDVAKAKEILAPLATQTRFSTQGYTTYLFTTARIEILDERYDAAVSLLTHLLEFDPEHEAAHSLLTQTMMASTLKELEQKGRIRNEAERTRRQGRLTSAEVSLRELLGLHSKDLLTATARVVMPHGGWSKLRKKELLDAILAALTDANILAQMVEGLTDEDRSALAAVVAEGGTMPWARFDEQFGNDMKESPWWHYHEPKTIMGRLRLRALLAEATVDGELLLVIPVELRPHLSKLLAVA